MSSFVDPSMLHDLVIISSSATLHNYPRTVEHPVGCIQLSDSMGYKFEKDGK